MSWTNVKLIFFRELRDQLRDRRTLFTIFILPLMLYPLLGMSVFQVQQFLKEHASKVRIVGTAALPEQPKLIDDGQFAPAVSSEQQNRLLTLELVQGGQASLEATKAAAERDIQAGVCDAVVFFPPDFADRLSDFRETLPAVVEDRTVAESDLGGLTDEVPQPEIFFNTASDKSRIASDRVEAILRRWREAVVQENLRHSRIAASAVRPFDIINTDVAEDVSKQAALWSKILPFVLLVWALTGAFYPAIDLCAGEKERGTLETLLSSPAQRSEIVWGKLLTVMTFSVATSLLNIASMTATGTFVITQLKSMAPAGAPIQLGPPPLLALVWLTLALIPISALFSALSLAIATFARSSKEGQYYLMPLLVISLPLMMLPLLPGAELDLGFALIPLSGVMLLLRALIEGQYLEALRYSVPVLGVTAVCCLLAIRWAIDQFNNESVLFRESERFDIASWLRHLVRDREETPTAGEAIFCGLLLLVIRFFASFVAPPPKSWGDLALTTLVLQYALIATPVLLMAIMLTRRPAKTLLLGRPSFAMTLPAAALLALLLHPLALWIGTLVEQVYPMNPQLEREISGVFQHLADAPLWQVLFVIAVTPAICEELAFRGFILSGLRRLGHKWGAIVLASIFFGLAHGILQQSLTACVIGVVIGYVAVKTGSLWPAMLYHVTHNSLSAIMGRLNADAITSRPVGSWLFEKTPDSLVYSIPATVVMALLAAVVLWWFKSLPYTRSAEERLQEALDHQSVATPVKA